MDDRTRGGDQQIPRGSADPTAEEFDRVLEHAEELRAERDRDRASLDRYAAWFSLAALCVPLVVAGYAYATFVLGRTPAATWPSAVLIGLTAAAMLVLAFAFVSLWRRTRAVRRELEASERALYETVQLLRETHELYSADWPTLSHAQFQIRLARFEIGPDDSWSPRKSRPR